MLDKSHWVVLLIIMLENDKQLMTVKMIKRYISTRQGITIEDLEGKNKGKGVVKARHMAVRLCYEATDLSSVAIAKQFNQSHSLVTDIIKRGFFRNCCVSDFVEWKRTWTGIKIFKEIISKHFNDCAFNGQALIDKTITEGLLCAGQIIKNNHGNQILYTLKNIGYVKQAHADGWYILNNE